MTESNDAMSGALREMKTSYEKLLAPMGHVEYQLPNRSVNSNFES
jgi:hypothetical protein